MPVDKGYIICVPVAPGVGEPAVSGEPVAAPSFGKSHSRRVPRRAHRGYARRLCWDGIFLVVFFTQFGCSKGFAQIISTIAGRDTVGYAGDGIPASSAILNNSHGICIDNIGNIFFADGARIRKIDTSGIITTIAGTGVAGYAGDGGNATGALINSPGGIAIDGAGNVLFVDCNNNRIRKINTSGIISTFAGNGTSTFSGDGGMATAAGMPSSGNIAIDRIGNFYVSEQIRIRKIDTSGVISTIAGNSTTGFSGDGGPATAALLNGVVDIAVDSTGNIFLADRNNLRIRKISSSGIISTIAGDGTTGTNPDGAIAASGPVYFPGMVDVDKYGNVFFSEFSSYRLRKVNSSGILSTVAGNGTFGYSGDGGPATLAQTKGPGSLSFDASDNLVFTDVTSIRKISSHNHAPYFVGGASQSFTVCQNAIPDSFNSLLAVIDSETGSVETWSVAVMPIHGVVSLAYSAVSSGIYGTAHRASYTPSPGYYGYDSFKVQVTDGILYDTITIYVTITHVPVTIVGANNLCLGLTATLSDSITGGIWSSGAIGVATIGSATGIVTSVSAGIATISYSASASCGSIVATKNLTVNPLPSALSGASNICAGSSATLTTTTSGGVWSSSNTGIATVGSLTGNVTGIAAGTATISYTLPTGCYVTRGVTIDPLPAAITGGSTLCVAGSAVLTSSTTGGVWSSSYPSIASVGSASGLVTAVAAGTATIFYTLPTGCNASKNITVNPLPGSISGVMAICSGNTTMLTNSVTGGVWSTTSGIVTLGSATGDVTGISAGTAAITYTLPAGCYTTATVTVNVTPGPITGTPFMCLGSSTSLTTGPGGGAWSSADSSTAAVSASGVVTGRALGITDITYTLSSGCYAFITVTVNLAPTAITGTATVCPGGTATLTDGVPGGLWSSGATGIATINPSTGVYTGVAPGTALISYTTGAGCYATYPITVNPAPPAITGTLRVCVSGSTVLTMTPTGSGVWSSSNTAIAYIGSGTGLVVGGAPGAATITYTLPTGCFTTALFTVNTNPANITGASTLCRASSTTLTTTSTGGTWSSNNTAIATVGSASGSVTGVAAGSTTISYTLPTGCYSIKNITVNPLPSVITGPSTVCTGASIALADSIAGGSWSKSNTNISIGVTTGAVSGLSAGNSVVTYTLPTGCYATKTVTVTGTAGTVTGTNHLCVGGSTLLTMTPPGSGIWSSSNTAVATVGTAGLVNAVAAGTANIVFTAASGCTASMAITVNANPALFTVTGGGAYCAGGAGLHIGLSGSAAGVSYQLYMGGISTGLTVAGTGGTLDFGLQTVAGTYTVLATTAAGCTATMTGSAVIAINPLPTTISGASAVCVGASATLSSSPVGGTWSSSLTTIGTIGAVSGVMSGIAIGTTIITYTLPTGCYTTRTETVSTAPTAIAGASSVCNGASITLTDGVGGGLWYASGAASVGSTTGLVTGTSTGTAIVTYSLGTGCTVTKSITVTPSPAAITGTLSLCAGRTTTLIDATTGGVWGGGATGIATIGTGAGVVTATGAGTTTISYTVSGCSATTNITVNAVPVDMSTITTICMGSTATLSMTPAGGIWSSAATNVSVNATTGAVTGITAGAATITYTSGTCQTTRTITVISTPVISGVSGLCVGSSSTLTSTTGGGSWASSNTAIVTITTPGGVMMGVAAGTATITYTTGSSGCVATKGVTVSTGPAPITGASTVCAGSATTLSSTTGGGTWTSSNTSIARVGSLTGVVTGAAAGTATITYSLGSGCVVTQPITVNALPGTITGTMSLCISGSTMLTITPPGSGVWTSSNTGIATVGSTTGVVTGTGAGMATISYTIAGGCYATATVTVNTPPSAITGPAYICMGTSAIMTDVPGGGTWSSSNTIIATIGSLTGVVSGVNTGFAVITYSLGAGCIATKTITVNLPPPGISGTSRVCVGSSTSLTTGSTSGVWISSNTAVATVGSVSGVVSGVSGGVVTISYAVSEGCIATYPVTVNAVPPITGIRNLCAWGDTVTVHNTDGTGIYSSTMVTVANLGSGNARVTSSVPGTGTVSYTSASGCTTSTTVTVNPPPGAITGATSICAGGSSTLSCSPGGGTWSSGATGFATVGSVSGIVSGIAAGTARISYTLPTGCKTDTAFYVNPLPAGITGWGSIITVGTSSTYADATPGGTWSSSNPAIATIGATTGTVHGVAPGSVTISYIVGATGCAATRVLTVQVLPGTGK